MNKIDFISKMKEVGQLIRRSFYLRIAIVIIIAGVLPSILVRYGIVQSYESRAISLRTSEIRSQMQIISNHLLKYNYLVDTTSEVINAELEQLATLYDGRVMIINKDLQIVKDTYGMNQNKTMVAPEVVASFSGSETVYYDDHGGFIEFVFPITEKVQVDDGDEVTITRGVMLISVSTLTIARSIEILNRNANIIEGILVICLVGIGLIVTRVIIRPFDKITSAVIKAEEGTVTEIVDVPDYAETSKIIRAFNKVLAKSRLLDETRKEFVSNVSHELKTPLTSMKVLADSLLSQEEVSNELYHEFMLDIAQEIDRENQIISDLLELVRLDAKATAIKISSVSINDCISRVLKQVLPIAKKEDVDLVFISNCQVMGDIDEVKFSLALSNLIENAIKYNEPFGSVSVRLDADHQFFAIEVRDTGIGIPEENLDSIFEKFYRVDKSHSREMGGTGLGLSIAKEIILLHKGTIRVESQLGQGTSFFIKIPLFYIKKDEA